MKRKFGPIGIKNPPLRGVLTKKDDELEYLIKGTEVLILQVEEGVVLVYYEGIDVDDGHSGRQDEFEGNSLYRDHCWYVNISAVKLIDEPIDQDNELESYYRDILQ